MDKVVEELNLNVVDQCSYQFEKDDLPYGATMLYLLSESHLSIHTFVDEGKITIDLFTCGLGVEDGSIASVDPKPYSVVVNDIINMNEYIGNMIEKVNNIRGRSEV